MPLQVGDTLRDRYKIQQILAQGGMGSIYRAHDESLNIEVAVKENLFSSESSTSQFHKEAIILASMRHPNLPRVTDHFVISGQGQYLVMDFIPGEDLKQRITRLGTLPVEEAVLITASVCDALSYLHTLTPPILHRDIKPGNIKIHPNGTVFLVDFGLAKVASQGEHTSVGAQGLTPGYAPPEQYGQGTDPRSDIYSLGATLYTALTNKVPENALARALDNAPLTPVRQINSSVPNELEHVVQKAMAVSPASRYQTAYDFRQELLSASSGAYRTVMSSDEIRVQPAASTVRSGAAQPPSQPVPAKSGFNCLLVGIIATAVIILGGVTLGGILYFNGSLDNLIAGRTENTSTLSPAEETNSSALLMISTDTAVPLPSDTVVMNTSTPEITETPSATLTPAATPLGGGQGMLAFVSDRSGMPQIWLMNTDGSDLLQITDMQDGACEPAWSPDGEKISFTSPCKRKMDDYEGSSIYIMDADGNNAVPFLPSSSGGGDYAAAWSPDGTRLAYTSLRSGLPHVFVVNLEDKSEIMLSNPSTRDRRPAWSPDGKWIAFETTRIGHPQIWYIPSDGSDKAREFSVYANGEGTRPTWSNDGRLIYYSMGDQLPWLANRSFEVKSNPEHKVADIRPIWNVDISPDGYWMVFDTLLEVKDPNVYRMTINGGEQTKLTDDTASDFDPTWRPLPQ